MALTTLPAQSRLAEQSPAETEGMEIKKGCSTGIKAALGCENCMIEHTFDGALHHYPQNWNSAR
jgi:hypothetical protein